MCRPARRSLQLDDRPSDPLPDGLPIEIAAFEHQIRSPRGLNLCIGTMLPNEQVRGSPDVEVRNHEQPAAHLSCRFQGTTLLTISSSICGSAGLSRAGSDIPHSFARRIGMNEDSRLIRFLDWVRDLPL